MARLIAKEFGDRWNQTAVVENHPGATGLLGGRLVAQASADGYTLLVASNSHFSAAALRGQSAGFDPLRDFAPVGRIAHGDYALAVRPGLGTMTVAEFVARARARPKSVTVATSGAGSNSQRALALLERAAHIRMLEIPYNGGGRDLQAVIAGIVDATFDDLGVVLPFAASGAVRLLAVCSARRTELAPDLPTFAETSLPEVVIEAWYGVVAPAGTPREIMATLIATLRATLADPEVRRTLAAMDLDPIAETPEQFATAIRAEIEQARAVAELIAERP